MYIYDISTYTYIYIYSHVFIGAHACCNHVHIENTHISARTWRTTVLSHITHIHLQKQGAQKRYTFFQELRLYLQDVLECMDVKAPALEDMEDQLVDARRCVCVCERERESMCSSVSVCVCVCLCVPALEDMEDQLVDAQRCVCVCERAREIEYVFECECLCVCVSVCTCPRSYGGPAR